MPPHCGRRGGRPVPERPFRLRARSSRFKRMHTSCRLCGKPEEHEDLPRALQKSFSNASPRTSSGASKRFQAVSRPPLPTAQEERFLFLFDRSRKQNAVSSTDTVNRTPVPWPTPKTKRLFLGRHRPRCHQNHRRLRFPPLSMGIRRPAEPAAGAHGLSCAQTQNAKRKRKRERKRKRSKRAPKGN